MRTDTRTIDMTEGPIVRELVLFSLPLLLGNVFHTTPWTAWWSEILSARMHWLPSR